MSGHFYESEILLQKREHYADDKVTFSEYMTALREEIRKDTLEKLGE